MRKTFKTAHLFAALILTVSGCVKTNVLLPPTLSLPKLNFPPIEIDLLKTCNLSEAEQKISPAARANAQTLEGTIPSIVEVRKDCKGVVTKVRAPESNFRSTVRVVPPANLTQSVQSVSVTNVRTCTTEEYNTIEDAKVGMTLQQNNGKPLDLSALGISQAGDRGTLAINIVESTSYFNYGILAVREGANLLHIEYRVCKAQKAKPDPNASLNANCETWMNLATKDVLVQLKISRPVSAKEVPQADPVCPAK